MSAVDVLAVRLGAVQTNGRWVGVAYVDGLIEFRTIYDFDTEEAAEREARKLRLHAEKLARENAAAARAGGAK